MKKLLLIVIGFAIFLSCNRTYQKPFVIVSKEYQSCGRIWYQFESKNGFINSFVDSREYNIGDTIK